MDHSLAGDRPGFRHVRRVARASATAAIIAWPVTALAFAILENAHPVDISRVNERMVTDEPDPFMANYLYGQNAGIADWP